MLAVDFSGGLYSLRLLMKGLDQLMDEASRTDTLDTGHIQNPYK